MYPVTQEFLDKMKADRRHVLAKVEIDYTDPLMDQSLDISVSEQANISYPGQIADGITEPYTKYAALDNAWVLGQDWALAPGPDEAMYRQMGWWGTQLAGVGGSFTAPYPTLTITHIPRPIHSLQVIGDMVREEYPVDFTIKLYDQSNSLLHTETVTSNNQVFWSKDLNSPVLNVSRQVLEITKWSYEGRQVKILEFFTSIREIYSTDDLISIHLLEEREVSQGSLPIGNISSNEIALTLNNASKKFDIDNEYSPLRNLLKPNRRIKVWLGTETSNGEEWVPLGTFWSLDWDSPDDSLAATVTARDRMELLRKSTFQTSQVLVNKSLYELAEIVLQDAGLSNSDYLIDSALQSIIVPYAWFSPVSHREALRTIAEAGLAAAFQNRDSLLQVESFQLTGSESVIEITDDDYFPPLKAPSRQDQVANEIIVDTQPLRPAAVPEEVYRSNEPITVPAISTKTITAFYDKSPVIDAVASLDNPPAGVSIVDVTYYGWGASVKIINNNASNKQVSIIINGKPMTVQGKERAIARDEASISELGILRFEFPANPLVQTLDQAQAIADALLVSVKDPRRDVEVEWRGNPALLLGNKATIKGKDYHVIRQELDWQGYLQARLIGRKA